jgi:hypothetical protein
MSSKCYVVDSRSAESTTSVYVVECAEIHTDEIRNIMF